MCGGMRLLPSLVGVSIFFMASILTLRHVCRLMMSSEFWVKICPLLSIMNFDDLKNQITNLRLRTSQLSISYYKTMVDYMMQLY